MRLKKNAAAFILASVLASAGAGQEGGRTLSITVNDTAGQPVQDAVVFIFSSPTPSTPPSDPYVMDQVDKEFVPHLLPVPVGGKVRFPNKDAIHHHIYSFSPAKTFELPLYKGEPAQPVVFESPGVVKLGCNIHDWMNGIILVLPTATFSKTNATGKASLPLPEAKEVELAVFHERLKDPVETTKKKVEISRSEATWTLSLKPAIQRKKSSFNYK